MNALTDSLRAALHNAASVWADVPLERLKDKGLAHDHVRLVGTGVLARIPKQSQLRLSAQENLIYQAACFERSSAASHAPRLRAVLPACAHLPRGALLVEEILGRNAALPQDLGRVAQALAALHALAVPPPAGRAPLMDAADPLRDLLEEVTAQAHYLDAAGVPGPVARAATDELERLHALCEARERPSRHLIAFDGHPGNFIVRPDGQAVLVDLEKCRYSYPSLDLAHATLYTSTTWDLDSHAVLSLDEVRSAYAAWADAVGPHMADAAAPWHVPLRRAMWLWSLTWCAKWRAVSGAAASDTPDGEDWSVQHSDAALVAHVRGRVDHYLSPDIVARVQAEFVVLEEALAEAVGG